MGYDASVYIMFGIKLLNRNLFGNRDDYSDYVNNLLLRLINYSDDINRDDVLDNIWDYAPGGYDISGTDYKIVQTY